MALNPHSEEPDLALPEDYQHDHPNEHPEDWGWHGEWGRTARFGGWFIAVVFLLVMTTTHYNDMGTLFLGIGAAILVAMLLWDRNRRKNAWRQ